VCLLGGGEMKYLGAELEKSIEITDEEWSFLSSKFKSKLAKKDEIVHFVFGDCSSDFESLEKEYRMNNNLYNKICFKKS